MAPTACRRMVSGTISLPSSGCFSPFPHGTRPLSVSRECLALPDGPGGFTQGSSCPALLRIPLRRPTLRIRGCHPLRRDFPDASPRFDRPTSWSYYPGGAHKHSPRFGLVPVRSPLLGESLLFSLPGGTKMFQFPPFASQVICTSPRIIAAYRVLHRLREPRHPPCALACFPRNRGLRATQGVRSRGAHTFSCVEMFNVLRSRQFHLTTVLLVQHVKDRCGNDGDRCRRRDRPSPSRSAKWRITDSNR